MTRALKQNQFLGYLNNSILRFTITVTQSTESEKIISKYLFSFGYNDWIDKPISKLPYLQKLIPFCADCATGMNLEIELEENGEIINTINIDTTQLKESMMMNFLLLQIIYKAQEVFRHYNIDAIFLSPNLRRSMILKIFKLLTTSFLMIIFNRMFMHMKINSPLQERI